MSLKAFHLVFITAAILLSFGAGIGLIVYECYFLKKTKDVGYL